ncbi:NUDIX domain-containing protein [Alicyclobacillus tolerans]|uniref:NUDIX domain-containing protein n=1 Tax=Alicyclobacillus tolerans TaxID=90970 RepID=UPI001F26E0CC|nr:NUDIX domain-containing protein [Alicyclobacillus tolerans]MCF8563854.1 NUDIX domain-containing protein [Alicyclobacillus tolerans]
MQVIVNCMVRLNQGIVMIQKPRRGWWFLPGGKIEENELWPEAARREVLEETGLSVEGLQLRGVHLLHIEKEAPYSTVDRMIAQFSAQAVSGSLNQNSREGRLAIVDPDKLHELPMDEGDRLMLQHVLWANSRQESTVFFGKFTYTSDHQLVTWRMSPQGVVDVVKS